MTGREKSTHMLAADVGGTTTRTALVDREGTVSHRRAFPTEARAGREQSTERLLSSLEQIIELAGPNPPIGVGVSVAGATDPETGVLFGPPNLPGWDGYSLKPALEQGLSMNVSIANDGNLAALAELLYGAGRGLKNVIYMTVSTGIGGGIIIDGEPYGGARGFAGELGHIIIDRNGAVCNCGNSGCLEALCSGTAVARIARERLKGGESSMLLGMAGGEVEKVDAPAVAAAARAGDRLAATIMDEVSTNLGIGLVSIINAFDPDIIVVGGGMSQNLEMMMPRIVEQIDRHATGRRLGRVPVVRAELKDDASLVGAAALAFSRHDQTP
jgi:glucokinase